MPIASFGRRARLAVVWQDLVTPVRAIAGYQEILVEEARRLGLTALLPDLEKVLRRLRLAERPGRPPARPAIGLLAATAPDTLASFEEKLRHDLRTPLNAIIGYSEMVGEDLAGFERAELLRPDLEKMLIEARQLLDRIDAIVHLTRPGTEDHPGAAATDAVVAGLLRTLRPTGAEAASGPRLDASSSSTTTNRTATCSAAGWSTRATRWSPPLPAARRSTSSPRAASTSSSSTSSCRT